MFVYLYIYFVYYLYIICVNKLDLFYNLLYTYISTFISQELKVRIFSFSTRSILSNYSREKVYKIWRISLQSFSYSAK